MEPVRMLPEPKLHRSQPLFDFVPQSSWLEQTYAATITYATHAIIRNQAAWRCDWNNIQQSKWYFHKFRGKIMASIGHASLLLLNICSQCQGGITCGAINEPRKSSKAIAESVIINFCNKNVVIARFRDKTAYVWGLRYRWDPSLLRNPVPALYATLLNAIPICWESMNLFWEETEAVRQVAGAKWFIKHFTSPDRDR